MRNFLSRLWSVEYKMYMILFWIWCHLYKYVCVTIALLTLSCFGNQFKLNQLCVNMLN